MAAGSAKSQHDNLTVIDHPLVQHKLALLRDESTGSGDFRRLCREITLLAAYEALADLAVEPTEVKTPIQGTTANRLRSPAPAVVGILRAGLVMVDAVLELLPQSPVGHLGMYRDPESHEAVDYYAKLPDRIDEREVLLVDPMLATGGSAVNAISILKEAGAHDIRLLCIIAAPEGVEAVHRSHPEVRITVAGLDEGLNDRAYIVPGLGDAGDRIYGTR
ncbi:MAG TPA: uracil phosphoribosyltransferase [Microthrixaceae bacterium]|nr:uracil phosphoribosyltransferase [Microthrixaceae bacterium]